MSHTLYIQYDPSNKFRLDRWLSQFDADDVDTDEGEGFAFLDDGESSDDGEEAQNFLDQLNDDERRHFFENLQEGDVVFMGGGEDSDTDHSTDEDDDEDE